MRMWDERRFGVDQRSLLESALARPKHAAVYEDADLVGQAASLCFGLIKNHPWVGGNKRTATHIMEAFLNLNDCRIECQQKEIIEMVLAVESDKWKVEEIENWLRSRVIAV
ncbi:MAG: type II toxin-antitoxin system death-on-curing family toxin [Acidobacteria bacterium]|nr:type II toxin-antitoxin system death-on-curing family toxin [Acidobacteriota bacterium]